MGFIEFFPTHSQPSQLSQLHREVLNFCQKGSGFVKDRGWEGALGSREDWEGVLRVREVVEVDRVAVAPLPLTWW